MNSDVGLEALKATPPVTVVAAAAASDWDLNHWVLVATLVYIGLQSAHLLWKWWKEARTGVLPDTE